MRSLNISNIKKTNEKDKKFFVAVKRNIIFAKTGYYFHLYLHTSMKLPKLHTFVKIIFLLALGAIIPLLTGSRLPEQMLDKNQFSPTLEIIIPEVPEKAIFAGEEIDLRSYDRRERMDRELLAFTYMHSNTLQTLKRANRFFPQIEPILKEEGIPDDFKYLMAIESSLNTLARSPAGAAGLWQIMPQTARELGLEVNDYVDERYDIEKSTRAACKYLKQAYAKYGNWMLVSASYNAGQGRISSLLKKQNVEHGMDLYLVEETSRYMFRLLAIKELFKNPAHFGFALRSEHLYPIIPYTTETVTKPIVDLATYAQSKGITYARLRDANPWLRGYTLPNKTGKRYIIRIPTTEGIRYEPNKTKAHSKDWVVD